MSKENMMQQDNREVVEQFLEHQSELVSNRRSRLLRILTEYTDGQDLIDDTDSLCKSVVNNTSQDPAVSSADHIETLYEFYQYAAETDEIEEIDEVPRPLQVWRKTRRGYDGARD